MAKRQPSHAPEPEAIDAPAEPGQKPVEDETKDVEAKITGPFRLQVLVSHERRHIAVTPPDGLTVNWRARCVAVGSQGYTMGDWCPPHASCALAIDPGKTYRVSIQLNGSPWQYQESVEVPKLAALSKGPGAR